jgi:hypothetical protein
MQTSGLPRVSNSSRPPSNGLMALMFSKRTNYPLALLLLSSCVCHAQDKPPVRLILKMDRTVSGPLGGEKSASCLRVFSDGHVIYSRWWNSPFNMVDKDTGKESRPEHTLSVEYHLEDWETSELSSFLQSGVVKKLSDKFDPPHTPIDYFEVVTVRIIGSNGREKQISTREFNVANLEEKSRYPPALIVLMVEINEMEKAANEKGKPAEIPSDCQLKPKER